MNILREQTTAPTEAQIAEAAAMGGVWKKTRERHHEETEAAIRAAVESGELTQRVLDVWTSMDVYNATGGMPALIDYWPKSAIRQIIAHWHVVKRIHGEVFESPLWELHGPLQVGTPVPYSRQGDEMQPDGDDSGGWFGGD